MKNLNAEESVKVLFDTMIELNWSTDEIDSVNDGKTYEALVELTGKENTVFSYKDEKFSITYSEWDGYEFKVSRAKYEIDFDL